MNAQPPIPSAASVGSIHPAIIGAFKSKTVWAAAALGTISQFWPIIQPLWQQAIPRFHLDPFTVQVIGGLATMLMIYLRTVTNSSLTEKGLPSPPAPPTAAG